MNHPQPRSSSVWRPRLPPPCSAWLAEVTFEITHTNDVKLFLPVGVVRPKSPTGLTKWLIIWSSSGLDWTRNRHKTPPGGQSWLFNAHSGLHVYIYACYMLTQLIFILECVSYRHYDIIAQVLYCNSVRVTTPINRGLTPKPCFQKCTNKVIIYTQLKLSVKAQC